MLIRFTCPNCQTPMEIDSTACGSEIACPTCQAPVTVPEKKIGPGVTLGGFKIEKLLGEGGMGQVWLARQLSMDRQVALKILPSTLAHRQELKDRFLNEVRVSARLQHPNIVAAHEAGEDAGVLFLAMDYVKGITLDEEKQAQLAKARLKLNELISLTVEDLVKDDAAGALRRLTVATANPDFEPLADDIAFLSAQARAASEMDRRIAESFAADKDKDVPVEFKSTKETVRIVGVEGTEIKARRQVNGAPAEAKFGIDKLGPGEKTRRLKGAGAEWALLRGLAALEAGRHDQAEAEFGQITTATASDGGGGTDGASGGRALPSEGLVRAQFSTALIEAARKVQTGQLEAEAQKTLETILTQIGTTGPYADAGKVAERIATKTYTASQVEPIHKAVADWSGKYDQTIQSGSPVSRRWS